MSQLLAEIARMRALAAAGFPKSPTTQLEIQRQVQKLDRGIGECEPIEQLRPFLKRVRSTPATSLRRNELNRVLRGVWCDPAFDELGLQAIKRAVDDERRSSDQAMIEGYVSYFPYDRPVIGPLAQASRRAAQRHDWAWRRRSDELQMFDPSKGPAGIAQKLVGRAAASDPVTVLREAGLGTSLPSSQFGRATFVAACQSAARLPATHAVVAQRRLMSLFDNQHQASDLPLLVQALLQPWIPQKPEPEHRKALSAFLLDQVGDPRTQRTRWNAIRDGLSKHVGADLAQRIVAVLKRWLTEVAMREFFRAIAKTTDRPDQWAQREKFWLTYLDAGQVSDAWPALGQRARHRVEQIMLESGERAEFGVIRSGPVSSSTIIMQIGDTRIAEWSDNGSCRFWADNDKQAPGLYKESYDGAALRTTYGREDFEYHSHVPRSPGWEAKFAGVIYKRVRVQHPTWGRGRTW